jgi:hypothetical protein
MEGIMNEQNPNPASAKEKAEGERETVSGQNEDTGSISNRPHDEERNDEVPPRGERKDEADA